MTTTASETPVDNGVNVDALLGVRNALPDPPEIAQFHWRTMVYCVNGTHSRSVQATIEADPDLHGILGADPDVRNGFSGVRVSYQINADATPDEIKALVAQSQKRSAVFDMLVNPTDVTVDVT